MKYERIYTFLDWRKERKEKWDVKRIFELSTVRYLLTASILLPISMICFNDSFDPMLAYDFLKSILIPAAGFGSLDIAENFFKKKEKSIGKRIVEWGKILFGILGAKLIHNNVFYSEIPEDPKFEKWDFFGGPISTWIASSTASNLESVIKSTELCYETRNPIYLIPPLCLANSMFSSTIFTFETKDIPRLFENFSHFSNGTFFNSNLFLSKSVDEALFPNTIIDSLFFGSILGEGVCDEYLKRKYNPKFSKMKKMFDLLSYCSLVCGGIYENIYGISKLNELTQINVDSLPDELRKEIFKEIFEQRINVYNSSFKVLGGTSLGVINYMKKKRKEYDAIEVRDCAILENKNEYRILMKIKNLDEFEERFIEIYSNPELKYSGKEVNVSVYLKEPRKPGKESKKFRKICITLNECCPEISKAKFELYVPKEETFIKEKKNKEEKTLDELIKDCGIRLLTVYDVDSSLPVYSISPEGLNAELISGFHTAIDTHTKLDLNMGGVEVVKTEYGFIHTRAKENYGVRILCNKNAKRIITEILKRELPTAASKISEKFLGEVSKYKSLDNEVKKSIKIGEKYYNFIYLHKKLLGEEFINKIEEDGKIEVLENIMKLIKEGEIESVKKLKEEYLKSKNF